MKTPKKPATRPRGHNKPRKPKGRKNPTYDATQLLGPAIDAMIGMMFVQALRNTGLRNAVIEHLFPTTKPSECAACKGECPCHTGLQIAGVPCPTDCPNFGNHFDGCHRCDCPGTGAKESEPHA